MDFHLVLTAATLTLMILVSLTMVNQSSATAAAKYHFYDFPAAPDAPAAVSFRDPYYNPYYNYYYGSGVVGGDSSINNNYYNSYWRDDSPPTLLTAGTISHNQLETSFAEPVAAPKIGATDGIPLTNKNKKFDARAFGTLTLTLGTTWSTYTLTTTTTCTTSTTNIKVCSPSKGRRRRTNIAIQRHMFDEEDEFDESEIFAAPHRNKLDHEDRSQNEDQIQTSRIERQVSTTHFVNSFAADLEPSPADHQQHLISSRRNNFLDPQGRFFIAFASSTLTTTTTSTYFYILTATCKSTTFYQTCGTGNTNLIGTGK